MSHSSSQFIMPGHHASSIGKKFTTFTDAITVLTVSSVALLGNLLSMISTPRTIPRYSRTYRHVRGRVILRTCNYGLVHVIHSKLTVNHRTTPGLIDPTCLSHYFLDIRFSFSRCTSLFSLLPLSFF